MVVMPWFVATAKRDELDVAHYALQIAGNECYLPRYRDKRGMSRPMFSNYIFIKAVHQWRELNFVRGVSRVLMDGDEPGRVADGVVVYFRALQADGMVVLPKKGERFKLNDRVVILRGPFKEQVGLYRGMSVDERLRVLFMFLAGELTVEFEDSAVAPFEDIAAAA
jgi:transcription antitermination factor NusG